MNKPIRVFIWACLFIIGSSLFLVAKDAFSYDKRVYDHLSREYNQTYRELLRHKIRELVIGVPVTVFLFDGSEVHGTYQGYSQYDDSVWLKEPDHFFQTAYGINDIEDISITGHKEL